MENILTEIITLLTSGITQMATGIGTGLGGLVENIFLKVGTDGTVTGLSTFGTVTVIFAGIGLAVGLSRLVVKWVSSLGGSRM